MVDTLHEDRHVLSCKKKPLEDIHSLRHCLLTPPKILSLLQRLSKDSGYLPWHIFSYPSKLLRRFHLIVKSLNNLDYAFPYLKHFSIHDHIGIPDRIIFLPFGYKSNRPFSISNSGESQSHNALSP